MRWFPMVVLAAAVACGTDDTHTGTGACAELAEACHDAGDLGDPDAAECHDVGHGTDEAACEAELDACLTLCAELTAQ